MTGREDNFSNDEAGAAYWAYQLGRDECFNPDPEPCEYEEADR